MDNHIGAIDEFHPNLGPTYKNVMPLFLIAFLTDTKFDISCP